MTGEPTPAAAGTNQNMTVTGLSADTMYYFAIETADEVSNWSALSNVPTGTTSDTVAPAAVSNLATSSPTGTSITLTWTVPGDNGSTGTAASYDIRYSTSAINAGNWASATQVTGEPTPAAAGTNQNMVVSGLSPSTTYYFAIETSDEVPNVSSLSNIASQATASQQGGFTYYLTGVTGSVTTYAGNATTYQTTDTLQTLRLAGNLTITGPQGAAWNPGNGPIQANFCDASSSTNPGQTWPLSDHTTHTLDFTFNDAAAPAGYSLQNLVVFVHDHDVSRSTYDFDVFHSTVGDPTTFIKIATACNWTYGNPGNPPGQQVSMDLTQANLTSVKTVRFVFRPMYWDMSSWIDEIDLNATPVDATAPAAVANLAAGSATTSTITLTWTAPGDDGSTGTAASYDIRYSTSAINAGNWASATQVTGEPAPAAAGTNQNMTVTGLTSNTTYYFAIKTSDEVSNVSSLSNIASQATASQQGGFTYYLTGVTGSATTYAGNATTYQTTDTLQTLRLAGNLTITGPQGAAWNPGNGPIQANFCDASSSTNPGQTWPLKDHTTHTLDFTFNAPACYTLQNLSVFVHDNAQARSTYDFDVGYSTVSDPTTFTTIASTINVTTKTISPGSPPGTQVFLDFASANLTNVAKVRFVFRPMFNGMQTWIDEIDLSATPVSNDSTAPAAVINLAASSPTDSSLTLSWTAPGDDGSTGTASVYDIRYRAGGEINANNWASATQVTGEPVPLAAGTNQSMTVSGLLPGTTYYFAIRTSDEAANTSAISNSLGATTTAPQGRVLLTPRDFAYLGCRLPYTVVGDYPLGFTHRYVGGQLRFLTGSFVLKEFAPPAGGLGGSVTALTNSWSDIWTGTGLSPTGAWVGLWFEQAQERLWTTWAIDYPDDSEGGSIPSPWQFVRLTATARSPTSQAPGGLWAFNSGRSTVELQVFLVVPGRLQRSSLRVRMGGYASRMWAGVLLRRHATRFLNPRRFRPEISPASAFRDADGLW